ncbi:hypothetical protein BV378_24445 [Nostoc sp. RF31YmG]|nr:hypothetical protein BV378_24445 [Nostoc sp. RF31YmG]
MLFPHTHGKLLTLGYSYKANAIYGYSNEVAVYKYLYWWTNTFVLDCIIYIAVETVFSQSRIVFKVAQNQQTPLMSYSL